MYYCFRHFDIFFFICFRFFSEKKCIFCVAILLYIIVVSIHDDGVYFMRLLFGLYLCIRSGVTHVTKWAINLLEIHLPVDTYMRWQDFLFVFRVSNMYFFMSSHLNKK